MSKQLKPWQHVRNVNSIQNLPPFCNICEDVGDNYHYIIPDIELVEYAFTDNELPALELVDDNYRGLCIEVDDHGNCSLLMRFKNGNTRTIWGAV